MTGEGKISMDKGFESAFTYIQETMVRACMENLNIDADMLLVYGYIGEGCSFFNFFFKDKKAVVPAYMAVRDSELLKQTLKEGTALLENMRSTCKEYHTPCPAEIRLRYGCKSQKFQGDYSYRDGKVCDDFFSPHTSFVKWRQSVSEELFSREVSAGTLGEQIFYS